MMENYRSKVYLAPVTTEAGTEAVRYGDLEFVRKLNGSRVGELNSCTAESAVDLAGTRPVVTRQLGMLDTN